MYLASRLLHMATGTGRTLSIFFGSVCLKKLLLDVFHAFCAQFPFKRGCGADSTLEKNHMAIHIFCLLVGFGFLAASKFRLDRHSHWSYTCSTVILLEIISVLLHIYSNRLPRKRLGIINRLYAVPPGANALGGYK